MPAQPQPPPAVDPSTIRTPSYTDRVLTHTMPARSGRLQWRKYDMADHVTLSDHRPVVAMMKLQ
eukprot:51479-Eustigmatos_ZCMA.PRE.1